MRPLAPSGPERSSFRGSGRVLRLAGPVLGGLLLALAAHCGWGGYSAPDLPPPVITDFHAAKTLLTAGDSTQLTALFRYGLGSVDHGVGAVSSGDPATYAGGAPVTVTPTETTTTYTLTVQGPGQAPVTRALELRLVPPPVKPVITVFPGPAGVVGPSQTGLTASVPDQPGCSFAWTLLGGQIRDGGQSTTVTFDAAAFGELSLTCTVTNAAGTRLASTPYIAELGGPTIKSFLANPATLIAGESSLLFCEFLNGTATITGGTLVDEPVLGGSETSVSPTVDTTYTLTVTDDQTPPRTLTRTLTITVTPATDLAISSFTAAPPMIGPGAGSALTAVFQTGPDVTARVDQGVGALVSAVAKPVGPLLHSASYQLTVTAGTTTSTARARVLVGSLASLAGTPAGEGSVDGPLAQARYLAPAGLVVDLDGSLVVADTGNHTLRRISADGVVGPLAGAEGIPGSANGLGAEARFNHPAGLAVNPHSGHIYVADTDNDAIREVARDGTVSTLAGTPGLPGAVDAVGTAASFNHPRALAIKDDGSLLFVADTGNDTIREIELATGNVRLLAGAAGEPGSQDGLGPDARLNGPAGLAWDPGQLPAPPRLYVADTGNNCIRSIDPADGAVLIVAGDPGGAPGADDGTGTDARFLHPQGLAVDGAGLLLVADTGNDTLRQVQPGGVVVPLAGQARQPGSANGPEADARFSGPTALAVAPDGDLIVADTGNSTLRRQLTGGANPSFAVDPFSGLPPNPGDADGSGSGASFRQPGGAALDHLGNLYLADAGNHTIRKITPAGVASLLAGVSGSAGSADGPALLAEFNAPGGVAVTEDAHGAVTVYVADTGNHTVRRIRAGVVSTLAGIPGVPGDADGAALAGAGFRSPAGLAVAADGTVVVADTGNHAVRIIRAGEVATLAGIPGTAGSADGVDLLATFNVPSAVALAPDGSTVYVADTGNHRVRVIKDGRVDILAGDLEPGSVDGTRTGARLNRPVAIAVDADGNLLVAENGSSTVTFITPAGAATTVLGNPGRSGFAAGPLPAQLPRPEGLALDPATDNLYITIHDAVLKVDFTQ